MPVHKDADYKYKPGDENDSINILNVLLNPAKRIYFEQNVIQNLDVLYTEAICLTRDTIDAEALVQKTLLVAFSLYEKYDSRIPVDEWLLMIMERVFRAR